MVIFRVYVNLPEGMMMDGRIDELMLNLLTVFHDILKTVARKLPIGRWQPPTFSHLLRVLDTSQYLPSTWDDFGWLNVDSCQFCGQIRSNLTPSDFIRSNVVRIGCIPSSNSFTMLYIPMFSLVFFQILGDQL
jgi:hypothetical protein